MAEKEEAVRKREEEKEEEEQEGSEEDEESEDTEDGDDTEEEEDDSEFDDPEGFVDDITDEDLLGDLLKEKPGEETGLGNIIVVDNAPKVGPDRMAKLENVLNKVFKRFGTVVFTYYPSDENGLFKGYFFMEFATCEEAAAAVKTGNGYKLDKTHIFSVNFFTDFEKYDSLPDKWEPPKKREFKEIGNLRSWLLDENCYDQCAIIYNAGNVVAICQSTPREAKIVTERERWTETYVRWSPRGTYLATFHKQGVALWGGEKFERIGRFSHAGVQLIDFSPCERYLVTFSNVVEDPEDPQNIVVWDIRTGAKKRSFMRGSQEDWPIIKWSHDARYFARMTAGLLSVYEIPSFGLLDKKSLVIKGIKDFLWSPTEYRISYWVPETDHIPAKIIVIEIPSRKEISTKSRHLVSECKMVWQKQGDFLCVKVDHWMTKSKKQLYHSFEIFHMREQMIPVDTIEIKEPVLSFALEPQGSKFAIIHGEPPTRISASFYKINEKGAKLSKIRTLERRNANHVFWSPIGQFVILAGLKEMGGYLEFYDTADMTLMNTQEHSLATDLEWDPTGRYVFTSVSFWSQKMDTGFCMWSFQGRLLYRNPIQMEKFCQLLWRPRPPSLLTEEDLKNIRRDYKKYCHVFEQKDRSIRTKASKDLVAKRQKLIKAFGDYQKRKEQEWRKKRQLFLESVGVGEKEEEEFEEETVEIFVSKSEEVVD